jgi:hypothetical protein
VTRALYILPIVVLGLSVAWFGLMRAPVMTESDIIDTYARHWVIQAGEGAAPTDCAARPLVQERASGPRDLLAITCENARDATVFVVDRRGFLIDPATLGIDGAAL